MKAESVERILRAFDELARELGQAKFDDVAEKASKMAAFVKPFVLITEKIDSLDEVANLMAELDEPTPEAMDRIVAAIRSMPAMIGKESRDFGAAASNTLPMLPKGRPGATSDQRREICDYVLALYAKGTPLTACKQRAAQRFSISKRSVERIWQKRAEIGPDLESTRKWVGDLFGSRLREIFQADGSKQPPPTPDYNGRHSQAVKPPKRPTPGQRPR